MCLQLCMLESENKDDELRYDAIMTLACMAQALLAPDIIPDILETINEVRCLPSYSSFLIYREFKLRSCPQNSRNSASFQFLILISIIPVVPRT